MDTYAHVCRASSLTRVRRGSALHPEEGAFMSSWVHSATTTTTTTTTMMTMTMTTTKTTSMTLSMMTPRRAAPRRARGATFVVRAEGGVSKRQEDLGGLGGDIGARDATVGELESGFCTTSLGHADTDHILAVPDAMAQMIMLKNQTIDASDADKLTFAQQEVLRKQVWDWKIRPGKGNYEVLRREYTTSDAGAMVKAIEEVCARVGWTPASLEATGADKVVCELGQDSIKGMCENDFILASKIDDDAGVSALIVKAAAKARVWF